MTASANRSPRPPPQAPGRAGGLPRVVRDELAKLRGKSVGVCARCGKPVFLAQSFTRFRGHTAHVRCSVSTAAAKPLPLSVDGVLARQLTTRDR